VRGCFGEHQTDRARSALCAASPKANGKDCLSILFRRKASLRSAHKRISGDEEMRRVARQAQKLNPTGILSMRGDATNISDREIGAHVARGRAVKCSTGSASQQG